MSNNLPVVYQGDRKSKPIVENSGQGFPRPIGWGMDERGVCYIAIRISHPHGDRDLVFAADDCSESQSSKFSTKLCEAGSYPLSRPELTDLRTQIIDFFRSKKPSFGVRSSIGWYLDPSEDWTIVRPDVVIGDKAGKIRFAMPSHPDDFARVQRYRSGGDINGVCKLLAMARGNTRLMLSVMVSAVTPIVSIVNAERFGVNLNGPAGIGKSTGQILAGSLHGCRPGASGGFAETLNITRLKLVEIMPFYNDFGAILDDLSNVAPSDRGLAEFITSTAMGVVEGHDRQRMNSKGVTSTFQVSFLSSSNWELHQKVRDGGKKFESHHTERWLDIAAEVEPGTMFETTHGQKDGARFSQLIKEESHQHFGHGAIEYLEMLVSRRRKDEAGLKRQIGRWRERFTDDSRLPRALQSLPSRTRGHFGMLNAAGSLLKDADLINWSNAEIREAIESAMESHLKIRQKSGLQPPTPTAKELVGNRALKLNSRLKYLHRELIDIREAPRKLRERRYEDPPVFFGRTKGRDEYFFPQVEMERLFGTGQNLRDHLIALRQTKILVTSGEPGTDGFRFVKRRTVGIDKNGDNVRRWVYVIDARRLRKAVQL